MKKGLLVAFLTVLGAAVCTSWLYVRVRYERIGVFLDELDRRRDPSPRIQRNQKMTRLTTQKIPAIQRELDARRLDGWLLYGYQDLDPLVYDILFLDARVAPRRRWFFFIPTTGQPQTLMHMADTASHLETDDDNRVTLTVNELPGTRRLYTSRTGLISGLETMLAGSERIIMQYSPRNEVPMVSRVDAGTVELVRNLGVEVSSSAEMVQLFEARWNVRQLEQHRRAATVLYNLVELGFAEVRAAIQAGERISEGSLQRFLMQQFEIAGIRSPNPPVVAFGRNTADPYYVTPPNGGAPIEAGGVLLLDMWGQVTESESVFADITWVGFVGKEIPAGVDELFATVVSARAACLRYLEKTLRNGRPIRGFEVDLMARQLIEDSGVRSILVQPTGHSLGTNRFGVGANLDGLDNYDTRPLIPGTAFTLEPGVYLENLGVRTEINVFVHDDYEIEITTHPLQDRVVPILR